MNKKSIVFKLLIAVSVLFFGMFPSLGVADDKVANSKLTRSPWGCELENIPGRTNSCQAVDDVIPDAATALAVGMIILKAKFGIEALKKKSPYHGAYKAKISALDENAWCITREPLPAVDLPTGGGHPYVCLLKKDGRVVAINISR